MIANDDIPLNIPPFEVILRGTGDAALIMPRDQLHDLFAALGKCGCANAQPAGAAEIRSQIRGAIAHAIYRGRLESTPRGPQ